MSLRGYFPWLPADLTGRRVAVVVRPFRGAPPDVDMVVHVNNALGWDRMPRCDELFTVVNHNLLRSAKAEFRMAAEAAAVIRGRGDSEEKATGLLSRLLTKDQMRKVDLVRDDPSLHSRLTTGVYAALYYAARGADLKLLGFSSDRGSVLVCWHKPAVELETMILSMFDVTPPLHEVPGGPRVGVRS